MLSPIVAFPLFLQTHQKHSGRLKSFSVLVQFLFHLESGTLFGLVFGRMTHIYTEFESLKLEWGYGKWWCKYGLVRVLWHEMSVERCAMW